MSWADFMKQIETEDKSSPATPSEPVKKPPTKKAPTKAAGSIFLIK